MRIVAGEFRGRRLHVPRGEQIRPTTDRVREAIFSIVSPHIAEARVLDLFAGTGAMGLEALSRGAASAVFVDQRREAVRLVGSNIDLCGARDRARIVQGPVERAIRRLADGGEKFDLVFMDPPYGMGYVERTLPHLGEIAAEGVLVVAEHHVKDILPDRVGEWMRVRERRYGDTLVSFFEIFVQAENVEVE
ncbi:MAG: 16S rRNA (guanine(966)-N(2))-methyltransferase RsmD [Syntrophobacteraceae bacterium]